MKFCKRFLTSFLIVCLCFTSFSFSDAAEKNIVVTTQEQLNQALKTNTSATIEIKTKKEIKFKIPASRQSIKHKLIINAPKAVIINRATFKTITFQGETVKSFTENGADNNIIINSSSANLIVGNDAIVKNITTKSEAVDIMVKKNAFIEKVKTSKKDALVTLTVHGEIANVNVSAKGTNLILKGKSEYVPVTIKSKGAQITVSLPINLDLREDASITLNKGAEKSEINIKDGVIPDLFNNTEEEITIKTPNGTEVISSTPTELPETSETPKASETPAPTNTPSPTTGGGTTSDTSSTPTETPKPTQAPETSETPTPDNRILGIYPSSGKLRVELAYAVELSIDNFYVSCPVGKDMTILKVETVSGEDKNRIYDLTTAYYTDNTYILTITLSDGEVMQKEFISNLAIPNITQAYAERINETSAAFSVVSEASGKIYYVIVKDQTERSIVNTKPAAAQEIKEKGTLAILQSGLNKISINNLEENISYKIYYIVSDDSEKNSSDILETVSISKQFSPTGDIIIEECDIIDTHQFIVKLSRPTQTKLELSAFNATCPSGSLTLGSVKTEDNQTYIVALKEKYYYYPKNTYRITVTFPDGSIATGSFYAETYPEIGLITVTRTSGTKAIVKFSSNKEGVIYYGTTTSYEEKPNDVNFVIENGIKGSLYAGQNEFEIDVPIEHEQFYMVAIDNKGNKAAFVEGGKIK